MAHSCTSFGIFDIEKYCYLKIWAMGSLKVIETGNHSTEDLWFPISIL